jgi:hypothetical protein
MSTWSILNNTNPQAFTLVSRLALTRHALAPTPHAQVVDFEEVHTSKLSFRSTTFVASASSIKTMQHAVATATRKPLKLVSLKMATTSTGFSHKMGND